MALTDEYPIAFRQGQDAFRKGASERTNPYGRDSRWERMAWGQGYSVERDKFVALQLAKPRRRP